MEFEVKEVSDADVAFPATVYHLMPEWDKIPEEFRRGWIREDNKWSKFSSDWFFNGLEKLKVVPKPGVDKDKALRHLACIQGSFEPKHEHKAAAVAYLASIWFDDVSYETGKRNR